MTAQQFPADLASIVVTSADAVSGVLYLGRNHIMAFEAIWPVSGPVGSIKVQVSVTGNRWDDIADSDVTLDGSAGGQIWNYERCGFSQARLYFTRSSGAGSIVCTADAKGAR